MDNIKSEIQYFARVDGETKLKTADVSLNMYKEAAAKGQSFKQLINNVCADADISYGCAFDQAVQAMGGGSKVHGGVQLSMSPTIAQFSAGLAAGPANIQSAGIITSPDGQDKSPAGRIFYPEIVMDIMRSQLAADNSDIERGFDSMIAVTENIAGAMYTQPKIDVTSNEKVRHQPIAQGADPAVMVNISTSQVSRSIPTRSIGLQITDQAANFATIDLVATAIGAQARGEKAAMVDYDLNAIVNGDTDAGISALVAQQLKDYDSSLTTGNASHKAFLKMLHSDYQKLSVDSAIMSIDTYLAFEGRSGRPTVDKDRGTDDRLNMKFRPMNWSLTDLNILIVDEEVIGANQALFLDTNYALRKVVDVTAQYEAVQQFVMRRVSQMRFDYGQHVTRLYDEASKLITLTYD